MEHRDTSTSGATPTAAPGGMPKGKRRVLTVGMLVLGIAMLVIGVAKKMPPPAITGVGFVLLAWGFSGLGERRG